MVNARTEGAAPRSMMGGRDYGGRYPYDVWMEAQGIPIHRGHYIADLRTIEVAWWKERGYNAAFVQLAGQEGVAEARVTEIPAGESLPPFKLSIDELVYVASGRGLATVWGGEGQAKRTFEWQPRSMFLIPHGATHQLSSAQGNQPARLLHYNYLPLIMTVLDEPEFYFNNPNVDSRSLSSNASSFYGEARNAIDVEGGAAPGADEDPGRSRAAHWYGNFFPDMAAWDKLAVYRSRGAGGHVVRLNFPGSQISAHMSVFPSRTYKKGHRHGPGRVIVIPGGEGYSILWQEGQTKNVIPWHEASVFVPPDRWFHQHFNTGATPARYLALHPIRQFSGHSERVENVSRDEISYPEEDPFIRETFESALAKNGLTSLMPEEAYRDRNFAWSYRDQG
jgi:oxalate decarboxylase/phosphoglucose isomerase-like protein (cupin superfamily)